MKLVSLLPSSFGTSVWILFWLVFRFGNHSSFKRAFLLVTSFLLSLVKCVPNKMCCSGKKSFYYIIFYSCVCFLLRIFISLPCWGDLVTPEADTLIFFLHVFVHFMMYCNYPFWFYFFILSNRLLFFVNMLHLIRFSNMMVLMIPRNTTCLQHFLALIEHIPLINASLVFI